MVSLFIVSCSQDSNDSFETEIPSSLLNKENKTVIEPTLLEIPSEFYDSAEDYVQKQLSSQASTRDVSGEDCITIADAGVAHIEPSCWVSSDIPDYGCDIVAQGSSGCYPLANNDNCVVCYIWVVLDCDGRLYWYNTWVLLCSTISGPYQQKIIE